jgi:methionyl-tRNA formyltransferase
MNIVFMGTPDFAVPSLRALAEAGFRIAACVTQPDRPKGRKGVLTPPPVKEEAIRLGIPVLQPERLRRPDAVEAVRAYEPDLIVTAAYGQILPKSVLDLPPLGCINVHASLLPKYRGAAPIQYAIMNGETETGVTIMYMDEGLDTGDMIAKRSIPITDEDDAGTLFDKLSVLGAELLLETLPLLAEGKAKAEPQRDEEAVYAPMLTHEDERIDWTADAGRVFNLVRALRPRPGAFTLLGGDVFKIWRCRTTEGNEGAEPGTVIRIRPDGFAVQCGSGALFVEEVQPAGKKAMPAGEFLKSGRLKTGDRLGQEDGQ